MQTKRIMILMMGLQGSGKSTFCREILGNAYVYVNLDTLKTRHREKLLIQECVEQGKSFIVDNTNPTRKIGFNPITKEETITTRHGLKVDYELPLGQEYAQMVSAFLNVKTERSEK